MRRVWCTGVQMIAQLALLLLMLAGSMKSFSRVSTFASMFLLLGLTAGCGDESPQETETRIERPARKTHRLVTEGGSLVDEMGRKVILRGVNVGGRSKMPPFMPFEITNDGDVRSKADDLMSKLRKLGGNGVRLTLSWEALEPTRGRFDMRYLDQYRALLDAAEREDLAVVVDFHQDVFQAAFCGDGFPEWALGDIEHGAPHYDCAPLAWSSPYFMPTSEVSRAFDGLWNNRDGLLDALVGMWTHVAREIGKHPAVAMFEVINEPGSGSRTAQIVGETILPAVYDRIGAAIEAEAGPAGIVGDEPIATTESGRLVRPTLPRFVYGPHFYDIATTIGAAANAERIRHEASAILARGEAWSAPVMLGEFGAPNPVVGKSDYIAAVLDAADVHRASAMAWEGSISNVLWNGEDFSAFFDDGSERAWAGILDRPLPRAIDGTVVDFRYDAASKRLDLSVEGAGDKVSEVYLPSRVFGGDPRVTLVGARSRFDVATSELLVVAPRGASWSLVVEPR